MLSRDNGVKQSRVWLFFGWVIDNHATGGGLVATMIRLIINYLDWVDQSHNSLAFQSCQD